ncbi:ABC transporter substrate-binding protein [Streptomyces yunnanensis]|uniref:Iron complex transport system substrate-binding protein n=1 Tax=Streptomyces yunnanensis TaxID=156453 RepID=A0A9X8MYG4_9ACTN|nr:iron-siderophore ABC transporter substrate-binding protein [Streptomyces yunnanensis]SHM31118.1 iron complex transport system substrate-binding protein [Streptomyces yunnanensis]
MTRPTHPAMTRSTHPATSRSHRSPHPAGLSTAGARPRHGGTARAAAVAAAGALLLTACGSGADSGAGPDGTFKAATCPAQPTTAWPEPAPRGGGSHPVRTAMGEVAVPDTPRRVVVLDTAELDSALTLGVTPVGATHSDVDSGFLDYLPRHRLAGIQNVGKIGAPNLEAIAALKPDLILTSKVRDGQRYAELKKIAPTVMTETTGYPWKQNFAVHAAALNKIPEAKRVVAAYRSHAERVTQALGGPAKARALRANVVRFVEGADTRVYGCRSYIGTVLDDIGTGPTTVVDGAQNGLMVEVGPEQITKADANAVFYSTYGSPEKSKEAQITAGPLWKNLRAVKDGRSIRVDDQLWIQGIGYTAADKILDEIQQRLAKK